MGDCAKAPMMGLLLPRFRLEYAAWGVQEPLSSVLQAIAPRAPEELESRLKAALASIGYPREATFPLNTGRSALLLALQLASQAKPDRDEIVVPAFVCPSVVETVRRSRLKPVLAPVDNDLNLDIERTAGRMGPRTAALLAVHMFGCRIDLSRLRQECDRYGALLIEDSAHILGSADHGQLFGLNGDLGILSFNQSKTLTGGSPFGGGALLAGQQFVEGASALIASLSREPSRISDYSRFVVQFLGDRLAYPPDTYLSARGVGQSSPRPREPRRISARAARVLLHQVGLLVPLRESRRRRYLRFRSAVAGEGSFELAQHNPAGAELTRLVIRTSRPVGMNALQSSLRRHGIRSRLVYPNWAPTGTIEAAQLEEISQRLIEIPFPADDPVSADQLVNGVRLAIAEIEDEGK